MSAGKFVAYYRVSTEGQGRNGLGLDAQKAAVLAYLNGGNWQLLGEYTEVESGKRADRPELAKALAYAKATGATLIVAKLDRLSRNIAFITALMDSGCEFTCCDMPMANRLTIHILAAVAEHEREMIVARTNAALDAIRDTIAREGSYVSRAGRRITRMGSPLGAEPIRRAAKAAGKAINAEAMVATVAAADRFAAQVTPIIDGIRAEGVSSLKGIARALNACGVLTARGGQWNATRVRNLLARGA